MNEKWILCENRLPTNPTTWYEKGQEYLTCSDTGMLQILSYCDGWNCFFTNREKETFKDNEITNIIAWIPLPDPYTKGE